MPYQNLDSEMIFALSIWLSAILVFVIMLLVVCAKLLSEKWAHRKDRSFDELRIGVEAHADRKDRVSKKDAELDSRAWEQT